MFSVLLVSKIGNNCRAEHFYLACYIAAFRHNGIGSFVVVSDKPFILFNLNKSSMKVNIFILPKISVEKAVIFKHSLEQAVH